MYLLETANIMFLSFIRFELLSFEYGSPHITQNVKYMYNSVALLLGYNQVFFHPEVLDFLPIYFPDMLSISGKPRLFSLERRRLDSSISVCTSQGQKSRMKVSSCSCHLK